MPPWMASAARREERKALPARADRLADAGRFEKTTAAGLRCVGLSRRAGGVRWRRVSRAGDTAGLRHGAQPWSIRVLKLLPSKIKVSREPDFVRECVR